MKRKSMAALGLSLVMAVSGLSGCGSAAATSTAASTSSMVVSSTAVTSEASVTSEAGTDTDQEAADKVAALIDAIYVQERTDNTDAQCEEAKKAWDALTDSQKQIGRASCRERV